MATLVGEVFLCGKVIHNVVNKVDRYEKYVSFRWANCP